MALNQLNKNLFLKFIFLTCKYSIRNKSINPYLLMERIGDMLKE